MPRRRAGDAEVRREPVTPPAAGGNPADGARPIVFWRRRRAGFGADEWAAVVARTPLLARLSPEESARLLALADEFAAAKSIEPVQGLELGREEVLLLCGLACLPVLELGLEAYRGWRSVVVYPGGFLARGHDVDEAGVVHEFAEPRAGESWLRGPVVLSWDDVAASGRLDGFNVVIHEMAHKLDMLSGDANGFPPLHAGMDPEAWRAAFSAAFADLNARADAGAPCPVDEYAAETPGEFFAVTSEYFFELPGVLVHAYPAVFEQLRAFYRQDPRRGRREGRHGARRPAAR